MQSEARCRAVQAPHFECARHETAGLARSFRGTWWRGSKGFLPLLDQKRFVVVLLYPTRPGTNCLVIEPIMNIASSGIGTYHSSRPLHMTA